MNKKTLLVLAFSALGLAACAHRYHGGHAYYGHDGYYGHSDGHYRDGYGRYDHRRRDGRYDYRRHDNDWSRDNYRRYDSH